MRVRKRDHSLAVPDGKLLRVDRDYVVYGVSFKSIPEFLVDEPNALSFPFFVGSDAVEIVDPRLSNHWLFAPALPAESGLSSRSPLISFRAMVDDRRFYQALVDGERAAVAEWEDARRQINAEE
jgi:hypothetical protein